MRCYLQRSAISGSIRSPSAPVGSGVHVYTGFVLCRTMYVDMCFCLCLCACVVGARHGSGPPAAGGRCWFSQPGEGPFDRDRENLSGRGPCGQEESDEV